MLTYPTIIIGAGASGLFCAGSFASPKLIIDHNKLPGVKVGVSGGGKCNFTNRFVSAADYHSDQPHFCKNALAAFRPQDFTMLLDEAHIPYEDRSEGRLFAHRAQDIVQFLVRRAKKTHTDFSLQTQALSIDKTSDGFCVRTSAGLLYTQHVVLATGGLSYPSLGASPFGLQVAQKLAIHTTEVRPALCGLTFSKELRAIYKHLAGNTLMSTVTIGKHTYTNSLLFTHEGISGPAVLSASLFWQEGEKVTINFLPGIDFSTWLSEHKHLNKKISTLLKLPGQLAQTLLGPTDLPLANASKATLQEALKRLTRFEFIPISTAGYTKAEVTAGGIDVRELNPSTFEVKNVPGLFAIGELVDVTGRLGGFNLHWAWASAAAAARYLAQKKYHS